MLTSKLHKILTDSILPVAFWIGKKTTNNQNRSFLPISQNLCVAAAHTFVHKAASSLQGQVRKLLLVLVPYIHVVQFEIAPSIRLLQIVLSVFINHSGPISLHCWCLCGAGGVMTWVWWLGSPPKSGKQCLGIVTLKCFADMPGKEGSILFPCKSFQQFVPDKLQI